MKGAFFEGWRSADGVVSPSISGISFDSVKPRNEFPDTEVVALFKSDEHSGIQFGRRWALYDELGVPVNLEYAKIGLMEDIEADSGGLPPIEQCVAIGDDAVVWFQEPAR